MAFTLVELLATLAILAMLVVVSLIYIPNLLNYAESTANKNNLAILNTALQTYKTIGGMKSVHSLEGYNSTEKVTAILAALRSGFTQGGVIRSFLNAPSIEANKTYVSGSGKKFYFCGYGTVVKGATSGGYVGSLPADQAARSLADNVVLVLNEAGTSTHLQVATSTGYLCMKVGSGSPAIFPQGRLTVTGSAGDTVTIYPCTSGSMDQSGNISSINLAWEGAYYTFFKSIKAINCKDMTSFSCSMENALDTLNLQGCAALTNVYVDGPILNSLNISGCRQLNNLALYMANGAALSTITGLADAKNSLVYLTMINNSVWTSLDLSGFGLLSTLDIYGNSALSSLSLSGCTALWNLNLASCNSLPPVDMRSCSSLTQLNFSTAFNGVITHTQDGINNQFALLPVVSSGDVYVYDCYSHADASIATARGWTPHIAN